MPTVITGTDGVSQVQTGAVESGDLPSEAYQKNNILGTVSESGGVPTGAIIERGSNANGEFVKYADGTLICTRKAISISYTNAFVIKADLTFPATFESASDVSLQVTVDDDLQGIGLTGSARPKGSVYSIVQTTSTCIVGFMSNQDFTSSESGRVAYIGIGRWY